MKTAEWDYGWLENPEVFQVNRIPAHSDHLYFKNMEELKEGQGMSLRRSLN